MIKQIPRFGKVAFSEDQFSFYRDLNIQILKLWKRIPGAIHSHLLQLFHTHGGYTFGESLNYFFRYPIPIWSTLFWITRKAHAARKFSDSEIDTLLAAHAMIMFLHGIDDHLNDGELKPGHLLLLVRSEAWCQLMESLDKLSGMAPQVNVVISEFISEYYSGVLDSTEINSSDEYFNRNCRNMATAFIVPTIAAILRDGHDGNAPTIRKSLEHLGFAWRLADDADDMEEDAVKGSFTSLYFLLSSEGRKIYKNISGSKDDDRRLMICLLEKEINECNIYGKIGEKIKSSLSIAKECSIQAGFLELANEYQIIGESFL